MKPLIGIVEWPYQDKDGDVIYEILQPIIEWVVRSGGVPIGLFPTQIENYIEKRLRDIKKMNDIELRELRENISLCDAIIKPGALKVYDHEREIYKYALQKDIPYLGICAGMQIMASNNCPNLKTVKNDGFIEHHSKNVYQHKVMICKNTKLYSILNKDIIEVNSRHNYHIPDTNLDVSAVSEDGIIEAIENPKSLFNMGFQLHPELLQKEDENSQLIFGEFIEAAKVYKKRKGKK